MRQPSSVPSILRYLVIFLALGVAARAHADDRADARAHYQAGMKYYGGGDYRSAIREFSAAQQIMPADLNNYNLALCYDKLGDAEPAVQYYRAFLDKQPNSDKRAEIEASISRLDAASRSAASKKADEARKADEAAGPPIGPPPGPAVGPAPAPGPAIGPPPAPSATAPSPDDRKPGKTGPAIAGSIGTPSTATPVPTGDSQLDRVNSINIDDIRDQRVGGSGSGMPDTRGGPAVAANAGPRQPGDQGQPAAPPAPSGVSGQPVPGGTDQPAKKETPIYKKWWFWAVVAISDYVVYELATSSSSSTRTGRVAPPSNAPGGLTLLRW